MAYSQRDIPSCDGTSALSAHLHFGEITVEQIYGLLQPALDGQSGENTRLSAERFLNQLIWRAFAHHILWHFPHTATAAMDRRYADAFWHKPGKAFSHQPVLSASLFLQPAETTKKRAG